MSMAAIYARVSTPGQQEDGTSLETQVAACLESAREQGDSVPPEYILQEQASGADSNRPLLVKLRQLLSLEIAFKLFLKKHHNYGHGKESF